MATSRRSSPAPGSSPKPTPPLKLSPLLAEDRVDLPGSERPPFAEPLSLAGTAATRPSGRISVSVLVRRREPLPSDPGTAPRLSRSEFRRRHGADPAAVKAVKSFASAYNLVVSATPDQLAARTLHLSGSRSAMQKAFGVTLADHTVDHDGQARTYRLREGAITIPGSLSGIIEAVLGLDNRPQARAHFRFAPHARPAPDPGSSTPGSEVQPRTSTGSSFTPPQIAQLYQFPAGAKATGQTIGLIELGGGYRPADITAYFKSIGVSAPRIVAVPVDGGKNSPSTASGADGEVMLDIEVAGGVAPGAAIAVYFAPNTDQGFIDAITTAVHDATNKPSVISISWGGPESSWTTQATTALDSACQAAALLGVTITVAAGDNGSGDGVSDGANHVDFPASSPHVLACGGTSITANGTTLTAEVVWNELASNEGATGGGVSTLFPLPSWQQSANVPSGHAVAGKRKKSPAPVPPSGAGGRGVPDVAGDADPTTGYVVRVDGQSTVIGGTSAVAPLWAGLIALGNARNKHAAGFVNPTLYNNPAAFRDITSGNNGAFQAGKGWDPCTGLGSPIGASIISALAPTATSKPSRAAGKRTS